jgi:hypothetical protein
MRGGVSLREIAKKYGLSRAGAQRHRAHVFPTATAQLRAIRRTRARIVSQGSTFLYAVAPLLLAAGTPIPGQPPSVTITTRDGSLTISGPREP